MIDFALGVLLVVVLYRGYRRGFIRELADLLLLVVGALVAFRTADASSSFLESWTGASPIVSRLVGGFVVFFAIQFGGAYLLRRLMRMMGPVRTVDRVAGVAAAGVWLVIGVTMMLLVASAIPFGDPIDGLLGRSRAVELVAGDESAAKNAVSAIVGDRVLEALVNLNQLLGDRQVVVDGTDTVTIPLLEGGLVDAREAATAVFDLLNRARVDAGVDPLAWSTALAEVAAGHGFEMYEEGYFSHVSPATGHRGGSYGKGRYSLSRGGRESGTFAHCRERSRWADGVSGPPREHVGRAVHPGRYLSRGGSVGADGRTGVFGMRATVEAMRLAFVESYEPYVRARLTALEVADVTGIDEAIRAGSIMAG